jgi:hypothetical protein
MVHPTNVFSWPAHHGRWNRVSARLVVVGHEWDGLKIGADCNSSIFWVVLMPADQAAHLPSKVGIARLEQRVPVVN